MWSKNGCLEQNIRQKKIGEESIEWVKQIFEEALKPAEIIKPREVSSWILELLWNMEMTLLQSWVR